MNIQELIYKLSLLKSKAENSVNKRYSINLSKLIYIIECHNEYSAPTKEWHIKALSYWDYIINK